MTRIITAEEAAALLVGRPSSLIDTETGLALNVSGYDLAYTVVELEKERDRLRDILDCETGKRAPGRWRREDDEWHCGTLAVVRRPTGMGWFWGRTDRGTFYAETCHDYALEAIEAADRAAKENA